MAVDSAQIGIMLGVFLVLISVFFVRKPLPVSAMSAFPACWAGTSSEQVPLKVIAIGDVHGNLGALLETLHQAEIIALNSAGSPMCQWKDNLLQTAKHELLLVQTGDIVDRGPDAPECWQCLKHLQDTAPAGVNVVRLLGNHDLMWLEGRLQFRHKKDTKDRVLGLISQMKREISNGAVLGAKAVTLSTGAEVLFVHAGLRPAMLQLAESTGMVAANATASDIAQWINKVTRDDINECINRGENVPCHNLSGPIYSAGPDRGGSDVGGIYWTDYRVLAALASRPEYARTPVMPWIQVVGHTAEPGSIRSSHGLFAICIDGGMQYGGRTFLEILPSGRFIAHEKVTSVLKVSEAWRSRDLTEEACKFDMSD